MFQLHFTNFNYMDHCSFNKLEDAISRAKECGFESTIVDNDNESVVASWSPINGLIAMRVEKK